MDIEFYASLISRHIPSIEIRSINLVQSGWGSIVLEINDEFVFRFPRRKDIWYGKEISLLPILAEHLPVPVPEYRFICPLENYYPEKTASLAERKYPGETKPAGSFVGYRKIPGIQLAHPEKIQPTLITQIGRFLTVLHHIPAGVVESCLPVYSPATWRKMYEEFFCWVGKNLLDRLDTHLRSRVSYFWESHLSDAATFDFHPALTHGDLCPEDHIFCDPAYRNITGVIDWEDACVGDPAIDFVGFLGMGGNELVNKIFACYEGSLGDSFWKRAQFLLDLTPFHELRFALEVGDESHYQTGLRGLRRLFSHNM